MGDRIILSCLRTKQVGPSKIGTPDGCCLDCNSQNRQFGHKWLPGEVGCCLTTARPSPVVRAALLATPGLERDDRSTPTSRGRRTTAAAAAPPDWKATSRRWPSTAGT